MLKSIIFVFTALNVGNISKMYDLAGLDRKQSLLQIEPKDSIVNEKRDKLDLLLRVLEITMEPTKKTHILYLAKINYYQLTRYVGLLLALGMLEEVSTPFDGYRITDKGRMVLGLFGRNV